METRETQGVYRRSPHVAEVSLSSWRVVLVQLDDPAARPRALEGAAFAIWNAIDGRRGLPEVVGHVAESFDIAADAIGCEVAAFIELLVSERFIGEVRVETLTSQPVASGWR